jgi:hypothetical protein
MFFLPKHSQSFSRTISIESLPLARVAICIPGRGSPHLIALNRARRYLSLALRIDINRFGSSCRAWCEALMFTRSRKPPSAGMVENSSGYVDLYGCDATPGSEESNTRLCCCLMLYQSRYQSSIQICSKCPSIELYNSIFV